ncbi:MAG TPA: hypothetical protein VFE65_26775 [Pseudonocardia sp.]|jgi:hypothetical protein|nr:hypothetical protein [Pseudonocardia sp.]
MPDIRRVTLSEAWRRLGPIVATLLLGAFGWVPTHLLLASPVLELVDNHRLAHLSAFAVASGCLGVGTLAAVFTLADRLAGAGSVRVRGVLPPVGFLGAALLSSLCSGHHELPRLLLVALAALAQSAVGLATSALWRRCVLALRVLGRLRGSGPWGVLNASIGRGDGAAKIRPRLWLSMLPRRGPPVGVAV